MAVPKAKKKKKRNRTSVTKFDLEVAEKKFNRERAKIVDDASATGTRVFGCLCFLALHKKFGFGIEELKRVQDGIDEICDNIQDDTDYNWNNVYEELYPLGFEIDGVEYDENGKVVG